MIHIWKISLFCFAALVVAATAADADAETAPNATTTAPVETDPDNQGNGTTIFSCSSICGDSAAVSNPDLEIEYNWNTRVPVCAGQSCESGTCSALERKISNFEVDEIECKKHQANLQEAGCECSAGNSNFVLGSVSAIVVAATMGMLL